jgi:hypothetical protein
MGDACSPRTRRAPQGEDPQVGGGAVGDTLAATAQSMPPRLEDEMGCLLVLFGGLFPRLAVLIVWIARPERVDAAFSTWLWPLLGIIFLPFATLIYLLLYTPGKGLSGWDWFWVILAALLDIGHWGASATQRNQIPGRRASEA